MTPSGLKRFVGASTLLPSFPLSIKEAVTSVFPVNPRIHHARGVSFSTSVVHKDTFPDGWKRTKLPSRRRAVATSEPKGNHSRDFPGEKFYAKTRCYCLPALPPLPSQDWFMKTAGWRRCSPPWNFPNLLRDTKNQKKIEKLSLKDFFSL